MKCRTCLVLPASNQMLKRCSLSGTLPCMFFWMSACLDRGVRCYICSRALQLLLLLTQEEIQEPAIISRISHHGVAVSVGGPVVGTNEIHGIDD